jgi:hypothetical protein
MLYDVIGRRGGCRSRWYARHAGMHRFLGGFPPQKLRRLAADSLTH